MPKSPVETHRESVEAEQRARWAMDDAQTADELKSKSRDERREAILDVITATVPAVASVVIGAFLGWLIGRRS